MIGAVNKCACQPALRLDRARVERQGMLEQVYGFLDALKHIASAEYGAPPEEIIQRVGSIRRVGRLRINQFPTECVGDAARDLALNGEKVADILVKMVCPEMRVV
jgi:hypothetical protein